MAIFEHTTLAPLVETIDRIDPQSHEWGFAVVKRNYLRAMTNEAFQLAIRPILQGVAEAHVAYNNDQTIYIAWNGKQKLIYKLIRNLASTSLLRPGLNVDGNILVTYFDPAQRKDEIKEIIASEEAATTVQSDEEDPGDFDDEDEEDEEEAAQGPAALRVLPEQIESFQETSAQKPYRRQLCILVVEDQIFAQKLLLEILRGVRVRNNNESPIIDTVQSVREAWKIFLKKAPDIVFIDLNLVDGSGHMLARAIKELDPQSQVIIVTANNFEEELHVARQNNVDGFITKPYNKKQILDSINRYIEATKPVKGSRRGSSG
jgi:two-component system, chemotaxis family, chemotaxis protein CheY